jgi:hypothetical protein
MYQYLDNTLFFITSPTSTIDYQKFTIYVQSMDFLTPLVYKFLLFKSMYITDQYF